MITFERKAYDDEDGDEMHVDCHDTHVEIVICNEAGAWVCIEPKTLRDIAAQLIRGAEQLEIGNEKG